MNIAIFVITYLAIGCEGTIEIPDEFFGYPADSFVVQERFVPDLDHILIPQGLIRDRTQRMAEQIIADMGREPFTAVCVLKGAYRFFTELLDEMKKYDSKDIALEFIRLKSYINTKSSGTVKVGQDVDLSGFRGKNILIVEDMVDTGRSMTKLLDILNKTENKPKSIKVATLLLKRTDKNVGYVPDYAGFSIPDRFVVGCGLDYNEYYRDLGHICVLNQEGIANHSVSETGLDEM